METSPLALVSMVRQREDRTYGTFDPVDADRLSEDLRVRCLEAIERYQAEHGTAPIRPAKRALHPHATASRVGRAH
jgi:hypothetical protein